MTSDLEFKITYDGTHVTTKELIEMPLLLESILAGINEELLHEAAEHMEMHPEIKKLVKTEALKSLKEDHKEAMVGYHKAGNGSLWFEAALSAAPLVALGAALKQFFGDAFKESLPYKKAKAYFTEKINELSTKIFPALKENIKKMEHKDHYKIKMTTTDDGVTVIDITVRVKYDANSEEKFMEYSGILED